jgi:hypothetical protein
LYEEDKEEIEENEDKTSDQQMQEDQEDDEVPIDFDDQQITELVHKFFSQSSEDRLNYMHLLKELLSKKLNKQFEEYKKQIEK